MGFHFIANPADKAGPFAEAHFVERLGRRRQSWQKTSALSALSAVKRSPPNPVILSKFSLCRSLSAVALTKADASSIKNLVSSIFSQITNKRLFPRLFVHFRMYLWLKNEFFLFFLNYLIDDNVL